MKIKEAITQLKIIATNMVGRLAETHDEREAKIISKQIEAIDMGIDALKTQIDLVRCRECKWKDECILGSYGVSEQGFCYKGER